VWARQRRLAILGGDPLFPSPVYITHPRLPERAALNRHIDTIYESGKLTNNGPLVRELEGRLAQRLDAGFCAAFCNGTVALQVALRALDLSGEVITTPFTFPATVNAIEWNGLSPIFCDIDPQTWNLDVTRASELVTERTSAILPVHVFGNPCDVDALEELSRRRGLRVVYDAAHAFAVRCSGKPIGAWGDLSVFSFHATKLFHTCEGGAIVAASDAHAPQVKLLRNFGIVGEEEVRGVGLNGKLSELHSAVGLGVLDHVDQEIAERGVLDARYRKILASLEGLGFQKMTDGTERNYAYFTLEIDEDVFGLSRDEVHDALRAENIISRKYFFPLCSTNDSYRNLQSAQPARLPHARRLASRVLCLPLYGDLAAGDVEKICECLHNIRASATDIRRRARRTT
jgi:dTDP-4-amino-4,6-dideoxygalactose transaminase